MKKVILIFLIGWLLVGCGNGGAIPNERLELTYLDERALQNNDKDLLYSEIDGVYVHDYIKENKNKAIRWTATVIRIQDDKTFEMKEPLLPGVLVTVQEPTSLQIGDIVTVEGVLIGYGETFGEDPLWVVRPAKIVESNENELRLLEEYQKKANTPSN